MGSELGFCECGEAFHLYFVVDCYYDVKNIMDHRLVSKSACLPISSCLFILMHVQMFTITSTQLWIVLLPELEYNYTLKLYCHYISVFDSVIACMHKFYVNLTWGHLAPGKCPS